ncbi:MAG: PilZ domain-containing protein [Candidatus Sumerlaeota bacterium]
MTEMENAYGGRDRRRSERYCLDAGVDFYVDADIVGAETVDVSQTGIAFRSPEPLRVEMRINIDGEREERTAKLVRAEQNPDGSVVYGLEFIEENEVSDGEIL